MVTDPPKNIVTNPAHLCGHSLGQGFQDGRSLISLPAVVPVGNRWTAVAAGHGKSRARHARGKRAKPEAFARRGPSHNRQVRAGNGKSRVGRTRRQELMYPTRRGPDANTGKSWIVGHGNSISQRQSELP
jgi:hypothetical protein